MSYDHLYTSYMARIKFLKCRSNRKGVKFMQLLVTSLWENISHLYPKWSSQTTCIWNLNLCISNSSHRGKLLIWLFVWAAESAANAEAEEEAASKKGTKKRKWGSKTSKAAKTTKRTSSMEISSDVLKVIWLVCYIISHVLSNVSLSVRLILVCLR